MSTRPDPDELKRWSERLGLAADVLRRRAPGDLVCQQMIESVESVAHEIALAAAHTSTWPAPGGNADE